MAYIISWYPSVKTNQLHNISQWKVASVVIRLTDEPHHGMCLAFFKDVLMQSVNDRTIVFVWGLLVMTAAVLMFQ